MRVRSASANSPAFARYGPRTGPRLAHSLDCEGVCCAITALPAVAMRFGGLFSLFRGQPRCSARENVLVDPKNRFFCRKTDFPRREVHFLASRAVFFGKVPFFLKKEAGALRKRLFQRKKASCSLENTFLAVERRFRAKTDVFSKETRILHGRRRISGANRTLPTPDGVISTMGEHEVEVRTLERMV